MAEQILQDETKVHEDEATSVCFAVCMAETYVAAHLSPHNNIE